jgi:hypothetical protein
MKYQQRHLMCGACLPCYCGEVKPLKKETEMARHRLGSNVEDMGKLGESTNSRDGNRGKRFSETLLASSMGIAVPTEEIAQARRW